MRKLLYTLILAVSCVAAQGQTADTAGWCPAGATWVYRKTGMTSTAYYRYEYVLDTLIGGHLAKKLSCTVIAYIAPPGFPPAVGAGSPEFYYRSADSIFWWNGGQFQFLYDFAAQAGDRWVERNSRYAPCALSAFPSQDTLKVRQVTDVALNGRLYKRLNVSSDSQYFYTGPVLRNIGSLVAPYPIMNQGKCFLMQYPNGAFDPNEFDQLFCYYDQQRGFVPVYNGTGPGCTELMNYILASLPLVSFGSLGWKAGPNPARESITVTGAPASAAYRISTLEGKVFCSGKLGNGRLGLSGLVSGIYLLEVSDRGHRAVTKLLKQ
ncbi:T9SS type A sorting domain-containing protein [Flaviaesturariibacter terrae]